MHMLPLFHKSSSKPPLEIPKIATMTHSPLLRHPNETVARGRVASGGLFVSVNQEPLVKSTIGKTRQL